ncbi:MAG TPA: hypothetical protein VM285_14570 [Polyangia bacterium]|nr:hypothetical protein [Polyangia bacterium]
MAARISKSQAKRRARDLPPSGPGAKPRRPDHWCSPCSLIAKGDERDCPLCSGTEAPTPERVRELKRQARGGPETPGWSLRHAAEYDFNGKPWDGPGWKGKR